MDIANSSLLRSFSCSSLPDGEICRRTKNSPTWIKKKPIDSALCENRRKPMPKRLRYRKHEGWHCRCRMEKITRVVGRVVGSSKCAKSSNRIIASRRGPRKHWNDGPSSKRRLRRGVRSEPSKRKSSNRSTGNWIRKSRRRRRNDWNTFWRNRPSFPGSRMGASLPRRKRRRMENRVNAERIIFMIKIAQLRRKKTTKTEKTTAPKPFFYHSSRLASNSGSSNHISSNR